jgi:hypothetical protein
MSTPTPSSINLPISSTPNKTSALEIGKESTLSIKHVHGVIDKATTDLMKSGEFQSPIPTLVRVSHDSKNTVDKNLAKQHY